MIGRVGTALRNLTGFGPRLNISHGAKFSLIRIRAGRDDLITIGENSIVECSMITDRSPAVIMIGDYTFVGRSKIIAAEKIEIGSNVLISWDVTIVDHDSHALSFENRRNDVENWGNGDKDWSNVKVSPVRVCDKAWIGFGATVLKGVTIGEGAIVAAKSVVAKDVAPWTLVAGNPARIIRNLERDS